MELYTLGALVYDTTTLTDLKNNGFTPNAEVLTLSGSGSVESTFSAITRLMPEFPFSTGDIKTALATFGDSDGLGFSTSELVAYWQQLGDGSMIKAGSTHIKHTIGKGLIVPVQLTAPAYSGQATISYRVLLISADGSASPLTIATAQALPAASGAANTAYILASVAVNGTALNDVQNVTIDFGLAAAAYGGKLYPEFSAAMKRAIVITVQARDAAAFATWGLDGVAQGATDSVITFDDIEDGGVRGSAPITATIDAGLIHTESITAADGAPVENAIQIVVTFDGTADPIAWSGLS